MNNNIAEITEEQRDVIFEFLGALYGNDVKAYWSFISKVDQARAYGMYSGAEASEEDLIPFSDYVSQYIKAKQEETYQEVRESTDFSNQVTFNEHGDVEVRLFKNTKEAKVYAQQTEKRMINVTLTNEAEFHESELRQQWKVRLFLDEKYKDL